MSAKEEYRKKLTTPEEAIRLVRDDDVIIVPTGVGEPPALLTALSEQRHSLRNVRVAQTLPLRKFDYFDPETVDHVRHIAYFFSAVSRPGGLAGVAIALGELGLNVLDVEHHREGVSALDLEEVELAVTVETRGPDHRDASIAELARRGIRVRLD